MIFVQCREKIVGSMIGTYSRERVRPENAVCEKLTILNII